MTKVATNLLAEKSIGGAASIDIENIKVEIVHKRNETDFFTFCRFLHWKLSLFILPIDCIGGVMVSVLASSSVDRGFESRSGETKHYKIFIFCFSAKHAALRRKSKDWLTRYHNNVSELSDISTRGQLFQ